MVSILSCKICLMSDESVPVTRSYNKTGVRPNLQLILSCNINRLYLTFQRLHESKSSEKQHSVLECFMKKMYAGMLVNP